MDSNGNLTVEEVVALTIRTLSNISVPVGLMGQIGKPIEQAIHNLKSIQEAWAREEQEQAKQEEATETEDE